MLIESEKVLDKKLCLAIKKRKGIAIKLLAGHLTGLPDRLCLLPGGIMFFAEIKTTGKKTTMIQRAVHKRLRSLGFKVYVIDRSEDLESILIWLT